MKKVSLLIAFMAFSVSNLLAQTAYNPFTQNIHFEPEPTVFGFQCGTVQTVAFTMGLTTADNATQWQTNPLSITVCVTGFTFNGPASTAVTGTYASNFDWAYDSFVPNCIIGTQNQPLIGTGGNPVFPDPLSSGSVKFSLKVPETAPIGSVLAVNVNLQIPGYMQQFNSAPDDNESTQTQTFCPLRISGTVYNDIDSVNVSVNGTPIQSPDGVALYAVLVGPNDLVVGSTPILADGTYAFENVTGAIPPASLAYKVILTTAPATAGNAAPVSDLPALWVNTGEDCCDMSGNDGNADGSNSLTVSNFSRINVDFGIKKPGATGPLPVVIKNFFASEYNCGALLSWTTTKEENTSHVDIYRSQASGQWRKIATVLSAGNSQVEKLYSYIDADVEQNQTYQYQLKFVDIDTKSTLSDIKSLTLDCSTNGVSINIYPNPASNELNVYFVTSTEDDELTVNVVDVAGKTLISNSKPMDMGASVLSLDIRQLSSGTYLLQYTNKDGLSAGTLRFVKN